MAACVLTLSACGGSDDDGSGTAPDDETAVEDGDGGGVTEGNVDDGGEGDREQGGAGEGDDVPDGLPSDFYLPSGVEPGPVIVSDAAIAMSATIDPDDAQVVLGDMLTGLQAAGYELLSNEDIAVFAKNGVGRVRVRISNTLGTTALSVDIDRWTDEQLDELRAIVAEPVSSAGRAVAVVDGASYEATGECIVQGAKRSFSSDDASVSLQIDETQDPAYVYADVTTADGVVFGTEFDAALDYSVSDSEFTASGEMLNYTDEAAGPAEFTVTATCDG